MFSLDEKFEYFLNIEKQIYTIIELNYKSSKPKIMNKIIELINIQNDKTSLILNADNIDEGNDYFTLSLYELTNCKIKLMNQNSYKSGYQYKKKLFETKISLKSIIRGMRLNIIRNKMKSNEC